MFQDTYGLQTTSLRYFNVYGPRQDPSSHYSAVIPRFIQLALKGKPLPIEGDGFQTRDFVYIEDVVHAKLLALAVPGTRGESINIGFGEQTSIRSVAELIIHKTRSSSKIVYIDPRPGDLRDSLSVIGLAKDRLGYKPRYRVSDGLNATVDWYRKKL